MALKPADRWKRTLAAQEQVSNAYVLCRLVALRTRQLKASRPGLPFGQAINMALDEVAGGTLALPPGWPEQAGKGMLLAPRRSPTAPAAEGELVRVEAGQARESLGKASGF